MQWYVKYILILHDSYIAFQNAMYQMYVYVMCAILAARIRCGKVLPTPPQVLYCRGATNATPTNTTPNTTPTTTQDLTSITLAYYTYDTLLSCYSLQKWYTRFNYTVSTVDILFIRDGCTYYSRVDLDNDIELNTKKDASDMSLDRLPGTIILPAKVHQD
jgi:hypothetical protein